jgi:hypothetical protein
MSRAADNIDWCRLCEPVARIVWGKPTAETARELRWGSRGSRVLNRVKGTWFDHEQNVGGGVLDLVPADDMAGRLQWLRDHQLIDAAARGTIAATYNYEDENHELLFQVVRFEPKDFRQRRPDGKGGWSWSLSGARRVLYQLPLLDYPIRRGDTIYVVEGEKDVHVLMDRGLTATCNPGGAGKWRSEYSETLRAANLVIIADNDDAGRAHALQVAASLHGVARRVRLLDIASAWPVCPVKGDIADWFAAGHDIKDLSAMLEQLPDWQPLGRLDADQDPVDETKIQELAQLYDIAYYRRRKEAAKELRMPVAVLDKLVRAKRAQNDDEQSGLPHWQVEPWPEVVSGDALLTEIELVFRRHIVLPQGAGEALALWVLHAWTMDCCDISPFLVLISPTKRCGKTSVLIILNYLTPRSELASNISASAVFRYVDEIRPTLLIDEADSFVKDNEELRGILNSGHTKTAAYVIRNVEMNGEHKPRRFSTWAPKAIATIRSLADTLEDRSVVVTLQRKAPSAKVDRLRRRDSDEFACLRRKAARWAADNMRKLSEDPNPTIPDKLNDRAADNWRPLLAIADLAGGRWPSKAREAACRLSGEGHDTALNVELLADIRFALGEVDDAISSADLVAKLTADPERPWSTWAKNDKPMTQRHLARLLAPFGIISQTVHRQGLPDARGYLRTWFEEAWAAYLPGQNDTSTSVVPFYPSKHPNADEMGTT